MKNLIRSLYGIHSKIFAATLGFAAVVEAAHFRHYLKYGPRDRVIFTLIAASASLYMASEALENNWPSWGISNPENGK